MIRPMTCLSLLAALGAGLYMYQEKHTAQLLDRNIGRTVKQVEQTRDRIGVLKAEWALLNEAERLQGLAAQHLPSLQSLQPAQFARLEDLPGRLPAPSAVQVNTAPVVDDTPAAATLPASPIRSLAAPAAVPSPMAQAAPSPPVPRPAAVSPVQLAAVRPAAKPVPPHPAAARPVQAEPPALAAAPAPRPLFAPVMPAYAPTPVVIHAPTVQTASVTAQPAAPFVGSALGMARSMLAAPVPIASPAGSSGFSSAAVPVGYASVR